MTANVYKFIQHDGSPIAVKVFKNKDEDANWIHEANIECYNEYIAMRTFESCKYIINTLGYSLGTHTTYPPLIWQPLYTCDLSSLRHNDEFCKKFLFSSNWQSKTIGNRLFCINLIQKLAKSIFYAIYEMEKKRYINTDIKTKNMFVNYPTNENGDIIIFNKNKNENDDYDVSQFEFIMGDLGGVIKLPSRDSNNLNRNGMENIKVTYTLSNSAPEILRESKISYQTPMWSAGCVIFEFIFGIKPFYNKNDEITIDNVIHGDIIISNWKNYTNEINPILTHLLSKLFEINDDKRLSAYQALNHPFCKTIFNLDSLKSSNDYNYNNHNRCHDKSKHLANIDHINIYIDDVDDVDDVAVVTDVSENFDNDVNYSKHMERLRNTLEMCKGGKFSQHGSCFSCFSCFSCLSQLSRISRANGKLSHYAHALNGDGCFIHDKNYPKMQEFSDGKNNVCHCSECECVKFTECSKFSTRRVYINAENTKNRRLNENENEKQNWNNQNGNENENYSSNREKNNKKMAASDVEYIGDNIDNIDDMNVNYDNKAKYNRDPHCSCWECWLSLSGDHHHDHHDHSFGDGCYNKSNFNYNYNDKNNEIDIGDEQEYKYQHMHGDDYNYKSHTLHKSGKSHISHKSQMLQLNDSTTIVTSNLEKSKDNDKTANLKGKKKIMNNFKRLFSRGRGKSGKGEKLTQ